MVGLPQLLTSYIFIVGFYIFSCFIKASELTSRRTAPIRDSTPGKSI
jgi:hypothetical protein